MSAVLEVRVLSFINQVVAVSLPLNRAIKCLKAHQLMTVLDLRPLVNSASKYVTAV